MDADGSTLAKLLEVVDYYLSIWKTGTTNEIIAARHGMIAGAEKAGLADYLPFCYRYAEWGEEWRGAIIAFRRLVAGLVTGASPGPTDWEALARICGDVAEQLTVSPVERREMLQLFSRSAELVATYGRVDRDTPPLRWRPMDWLGGDDGAVWLEMQYRYASAPHAQMRIIWKHDANTWERVGWKNDEKYRERVVAALRSWVQFAEWKAGQTDSEENVPQRATSTRPPSPRDRIRKQRLEFIESRIAKKDETTWSAIYDTYHREHPKDTNASADALRLTWKRHLERKKNANSAE